MTHPETSTILGIGTILEPNHYKSKINQPLSGLIYNEGMLRGKN